MAGADSPVGGDPVAVAGQRVPSWLLALVPLLLIAVALGVFVGLGGPGLGERRGPPVEELAVEKTTLRPGVIELLVRNDGPDDVSIAQVQVNDAFAQFSGADQPIGRLHTAAVRVEQPWIEGEAYEVSLLTATGGTIIHEIPVAVATPETDVSFFALMALLGVYVGVIPIALGMLWLPWIGRISSRWLRLIMALTVGLLAFLAVDATLEGFKSAGEGSQAFGGPALVVIGAAIAYLSLSGVSEWLARRSRRPVPRGDRATPWRCWWPSASVFTTWGRAWRSARLTRSARSRWGRSWSSASPSTTPPRGSRSLPRWPTGGLP